MAVHGCRSGSKWEERRALAAVLRGVPRRARAWRETEEFEGRIAEREGSGRCADHEHGARGERAGERHRD
eukprot:1250518-Rhodomonas_salina.1